MPDISDNLRRIIATAQEGIDFLASDNIISIPAEGKPQLLGLYRRIRDGAEEKLNRMSDDV